MHTMLKQPPPLPSSCSNQAPTLPPSLSPLPPLMLQPGTHLRRVAAHDAEAARPLAIQAHVLGKALAAAHVLVAVSKEDADGRGILVKVTAGKALEERGLRVIGL